MANKVLNRIASLDFQRGLAIFFMVFLHVILHNYDISWAYDLDMLFAQPIYVIIIVLLMAYAGTWVGYFILISSIVNSIAMTKRADRGDNPKNIMLKQVLTGVGILIAGLITESLGYHGYFGSAIRNPANWANASNLWRRFFVMEALQIIGWCMVITGLVHYFLIRKKGYLKTKRNIMIYSAIIIGWLVVMPFIFNWVDNLPWNPVEGKAWPDSKVALGNASFTTWLLAILAGSPSPLVPYLATSFLGTIFGIAIANKKNGKKIARYGAIVTLAAFVIGVLLTVAGMDFDITWDRPLLNYYLIALGGQIGMITLLFWLVEVKGDPKKFANNKFVKLFRRWGMIALTIYMLQIFEALPEYIVTLVTGVDVYTRSTPLASPWATLLLAGFVLLCYDLLIRAWSKVNFKYSPEWFIIRLVKKPRKTLSERLNVKKMMNQVEWISYK